MFPATTRRVERNTSPVLNDTFRQQLKESVARHVGARRHAIDRRLAELDSEWNVERVVETEAPATIVLGIVLGLMHSRKWFALSAFAAGMVLMHNLQGWYPLLPLLRRMGLRAQHEIELERSALRALRGDYRAYQPDHIH